MTSALGTVSLADMGCLFWYYLNFSDWVQAKSFRILSQGLQDANFRTGKIQNWRTGISELAGRRFQNKILLFWVANFRTGKMAVND